MSYIGGHKDAPLKGKARRHWRESIMTLIRAIETNTVKKIAVVINAVWEQRTTIDRGF